MPRQLTISLNEILFIFTRAGFGVNASIGISEDFARSNMWLAENGFDPSLCSIVALDSLDEGKSSLVIEQSNDGFSGPSSQYLSALQASVSALDWIKTDQGVELTIANVDSPLLLVAALGANKVKGWQVCWCDETGANFQVNFMTSDQWQIINEGSNAIELSKGATMTVSLSGNAETDLEGEMRKFDSKIEKNKILQTGVTVHEHWDAIYAYFCRCLVKSTAESRASGAGAGLVDTD
ncbi:MAG: hypothetical protein AAEF72_07065 [Gammaproteobacteria bacterium]